MRFLRGRKVKRIEKGGLVILPHVTEMRNGLFRPEIAWSKGKATDIIFGEIVTTRLRAELNCWQAAVLATMSAAATANVWEETERSIAGCRRLAEMLMASI